jgi:hypothetical protein
MIFAVIVNGSIANSPKTSLSREVQFGDVTGTYQNINGWVDLSLSSGDAVTVAVGTNLASITMYVAAASLSVQLVN